MMGLDFKRKSRITILNEEIWIEPSQSFFSSTFLGFPPFPSYVCSPRHLLTSIINLCYLCYHCPNLFLIVILCELVLFPTWICWQNLLHSFTFSHFSKTFLKHISFSVSAFQRFWEISHFSDSQKFVRKHSNVFHERMSLSIEIKV